MADRIPNPIFWREIRGAARDPRIVGLVLGFFLALSGILLFLWPRSGVFSLASDSSMQIFSIFFMSNLALVILIVPALSSPSITSERENNSFDLLFTSLLSPGEILRGKLLAAIAMILVVVLVSMPISALCALSGGIGPGLLLRAYVVILMAALTYGILALAVSTLCRTTFSAIILTYIAVAVLAGTTWLPYYLMGRLSMLKHLWLLLRAVSPFDALYALLYPTRYQLTELSQVSTHPLAPFYLHLAGMSALLVLFLIIFCRYILSPPKPGTLYRWLAAGVGVILLVALAAEYNLWSLANQPLNRRGGNFQETSSPLNIILISVAVNMVLLLVLRGLLLASRGEHEKYHAQYSDARTVVKRKLTWPFYLIDPLRRKNPIGRWRNPVFVAEMRSKLFGQPRVIIRGTAACIIASLVLLILVSVQYATFLSPDIVRWVAVVFQLGIVAILAPAISSGSITDEVTSRTFLMLRMTPLSALTVVLGKLKAAFLYVSIFLVSSLPVLLALIFLEPSTTADQAKPLGLLPYLAVLWDTGGWRVTACLAIMLVTTILFISAGFCASAWSKTTSGATAISYGFAGVITIVTLAANIPGAFSEPVSQAMLTLNPMVAALRVTSDELFGNLSPQVWVHNLALLGGLALGLIALSAGRVYYIFTRHL